jgi:lipopolysaccharide export LptBFGC system permease protein LptF
MALVLALILAVCAIALRNQRSADYLVYLLVALIGPALAIWIHGITVGQPGDSGLNSAFALVFVLIFGLPLSCLAAVLLGAIGVGIDWAKRNWTNKPVAGGPSSNAPKREKH